ncbi:MAG: radical SAM protein [Candidatus Omnitrophota bacterium]
MVQPAFKYIYGPVYSWRMGMSLGVDPIATQAKVCNFNCTYCQLGRAGCEGNTFERRLFVSVEDVVAELEALDTDTGIDYVTFSGNGEPTLAANLGEMLLAVRCVRPEKTAVITNGTLLGLKDVRSDVCHADFVLVKLDAADEASFQAVNAPADGLSFKGIINGIKAFRHDFKGRFALQVMFVSKNKAQAAAMAQVVRGIGADEIQLNTPLRPGGEKPLTPEEMTAIKACFTGLPVRSVYEEEKKLYHPLDQQATERRHGVII